MPQNQQRSAAVNSNPKRKKHDKRVIREEKSAGIVQQSSTETLPQEDDLSLWNTFKSHPLVMISPFVLIPACLYYLFHFFLLQHPEWIAAITFKQIQLRPAVRQTDTRQVLIVGTMSSEMMHLATKLRQIFYLEIKHENSNAESTFVRDGTVSSLLGIRYIMPSQVEDQVAANTVNALCVNRTKKGSAAGFQPNLYCPSNCSYLFSDWSKCRAGECLSFLQQEWGCALMGTCVTPYKRVLHMVQHPIRTLQELLAKVCPGQTSIHPVFRQYATVFLDDIKTTSCLEALAWYIIRYHSAMFAARQQQLIHDSFQIENESLCGIVRRAGFLNTDVVYAPHTKRLSLMCQEGKGDSQIQHGSVITTIDKTRSLPPVTWDSLEQAGGSRLAETFRALCIRLGYNPDDVGDDKNAKATTEEVTEEDFPGSSETETQPQKVNGDNGEL